MSYLGKYEQRATNIKRFDVTSSTSTTHTLTWVPVNEQSLFVTINGVKQQEDAYSVSGAILTLTDALVATDKMEVIGIQDVGVGMVPADGVVKNVHINDSAAIAQSKLATLAIDTAELADDAVTADKLANSINTEISANTAKVTNATHTGDVTGATALTIAVDAVDIAMLSATGSASSSTFLRGDNAWAAAGGGKVLQVLQATKTDTQTTTTAGWVDVTGLSIAITPAATSSKILVTSTVLCIGTVGAAGAWTNIVRDSTEIAIATSVSSRIAASAMGYAPDGGDTRHHSTVWLDSPSTTSETTYKVQFSANGTYTAYINRSAADTDNSSYARGVSTITVMEIGV